MKRNNFNDLKFSFQLVGEGDVLVDAIQSYPVLLMNEPKTGLLHIRFVLPEQLYHRIMPAFEDEMKEVGFYKMTYQKEIMNLVIRQKDHAIVMYEAFRKWMSLRISPSLNELTCGYCGGFHCDTLAIKDDLYQPVHASCHTSYLQSLKEPMEKSKGIDYIKGSVGALIGALLPMLLSLVMIMITNTSFGYLYLLSAYAAIQGYKYLNGPQNQKGFMITILCCCIAFFVFMYADCFYSIYDSGYGTYFGIGDQFSMINSVLFSWDFFEMFGFEALFFLLGIGSVMFMRPFSRKKMIQTQERLDQFSQPIQQYSNNEVYTYREI